MTGDKKTDHTFKGDHDSMKKKKEVKGWEEQQDQVLNSAKNNFGLSIYGCKLDGKRENKQDEEHEIMTAF